MSLTDLFSVLAVTTPIGCGVSAGWSSGITGVIAGLVIGAAIAVVGFFGVRAVIKRAALHPDLGRGTTPVWRFLSKLLAFALYLWIFVSGLLAMFITKSLVHHVAA
jgi:hypothetical protein